MVVSPNQAPDPKDVEDALRALNESGYERDAPM